MDLAQFPTRILASATLSGTVAGVVSAAALAGLSVLQGTTAAQPLNATSHWWHGDRAADTDGFDLPHTGLGFATHHASSVFWALLFETLRARDGRSSLGPIVRDAALVSATASLVDYGIVSRRLSPGWELVLPARSVAAGFVALAAGLTLGGLLSRPLHQQTADAGTRGRAHHAASAADAPPSAATRGSGEGLPDQRPRPAAPHLPT